MKTFLLILTFILMGISLETKAQSVMLQTKRYVAPFIGIEVQDSAVFELPMIIGGVSNDIQHRLDPYLSPDSLLGDNIDSVIANYKEWRAGLVGSTYRVLYNNNGVLSISIAVETLGAYPDMFYTDVNLNLIEGKRIEAANFLIKSKMKDLAADLDKIMQKRIKDKIKEEQIGEEDALQFFDGAKFTEENLSHFAFTEKGIVFYYNYGLPHAVNALSPDEDFLVTWNDIENYLREGSIAYRIINK